MRVDHVDSDSGASVDSQVRSETSPAKKISLAMLLLGVGLLWPVPLGGAVFLVAAGVGLAIVSEAELTEAAPATASLAVAPTREFPP
jgi:hypothetical protein